MVRNVFVHSRIGHSQAIRAINVRKPLKTSVIMGVSD
jgi:hypothetical protein